EPSTPPPANNKWIASFEDIVPLLSRRVKEKSAPCHCLPAHPPSSGPPADDVATRTISSSCVCRPSSSRPKTASRETFRLTIHLSSCIHLSSYYCRRETSNSSTFAAR